MAKTYGKIKKIPIESRIRPKWDRYPDNWKEISTRILKKYKYTCQFCGAKKGEIDPITMKPKVITVAHMDHDKQNCRETNLLALCTSCHSTYDQGDWGYKSYGPE